MQGKKIRYHIEISHVKHGSTFRNALNSAASILEPKTLETVLKQDRASWLGGDKTILRFFVKFLDPFKQIPG
jgi:hypothetical protein